MEKAVSLYIKDEGLKEKAKQFCSKNHLTLSELVTLLIRDFFETNATICISNDKTKIVRG